jgi:hypothetical protein
VSYASSSPCSASVIWVERIRNRCRHHSGFDIIITVEFEHLQHSDGTSRLTLCAPNGVNPKGNAEGSTFRKTLGVLLAGELGIELRRVSSGTRRTFSTVGEAALTHWMTDNALVSWVVRPEPWVVEVELIATFDVPLNLQGNAHNWFYPELKRLRAEAEQNARNLPVV